MNQIPKALFRLGHIVATPNALQVLSQEDIFKGISRHQAGDWGESEDPELNARALIDGTRIFSVYRSSQGTIFWIITEADRSATTVLLPEDY